MYVPFTCHVRASVSSRVPSPQASATPFLDSIGGHGTAMQTPGELSNALQAYKSLSLARKTSARGVHRLHTHSWGLLPTVRAAVGKPAFCTTTCGHNLSYSVSAPRIVPVRSSCIAACSPARKPQAAAASRSLLCTTLACMWQASLCPGPNRSHARRSQCCCWCGAAGR